MKLPLMQKILFPLLIVGSVMGIVFVSNWASAPDYAVIYSDLSAPDSAAIVTRLKEQKVKYQIRGDGTTIAISPPEMVHEIRLSLATDGLPKGGNIGLELFDATNLGTTTFQEKVKWMRAIQGELERTIGTIDAVQTARVHITQPERSVFSKKGSEPTASVLLKLRPGGELDKKQIKGISNLVAGSVEGLKRENVSIVDVFGNLLTTSDEDGEGLGMEATRIQYQREIEKNYVQRIEQMLSKVLGAGKVIARVSTELDFSQTEKQEEIYDPSGQVIRSERTMEEGTGQSQRGGIPGVVSNLSTDPKVVAPAQGGEDKSVRREALKNYEVSKAISKSTSPRGKLVRLSVAVLVDSTYNLKDGTAGASAEPKTTTANATTDTSEEPTITPETISQIEAIAKSAVGFDVDRGDSISVEAIPFKKSETDYNALLDSKGMQDLIFNVIFKAAPVVFIILFFLILVKPLVKFLVTPTEAEVDLTRLLPTGIAELEQELEAERGKAQLPTYEPAVDLEQLEELISDNSRIVKESPTQAALLIRYWLNDGRL
jgi:flagellar M-ring protein FliF